MITETILNPIVTLLLGIIGLFPQFPEIKTDGFDSVFQFLTLADTFVSLKTFVSCVVIILVIYNLELFWSAIMWVVRKIPNIQ